MFRPCTQYPALLVGLLTALLVGTSSSLAADDKAAPLERKALDERVEKTLVDIINRGVELFNAGDAAGCCRFFEGALRMARPLLDHHPSVQKRIDASLADAARVAAADERAFALRDTLRRIRIELNPKAAERPLEEPKRDGTFTLSDTEKAVLELTNQERAKQGLPALKASEKLFQAARAHSANMARLERLDHTLDGKGPGERLQEIGYAHAGWGENCAAGQRTPAEALATWMNSDGHRANILGAGYTEIGIGVATSAGGGIYWTQVFAVPRGR